MSMTTESCCSIPISIHNIHGKVPQENLLRIHCQNFFYCSQTLDLLRTRCLPINSSHHTCQHHTLPLALDVCTTQPFATVCNSNNTPNSNLSLQALHPDPLARCCLACDCHLCDQLGLQSVKHDSGIFHLPCMFFAHLPNHFLQG